MTESCPKDLFSSCALKHLEVNCKTVFAICHVVVLSLLSLVKGHGVHNMICIIADAINCNLLQICFCSYLRVLVL